MSDGEDKAAADLYSILGLNRACSTLELRSAYKKLAMRWHPDRCHGSGDSKMEEAKSKFQEIQEAYSVLSDANKRLLYDVGAYRSVDRDDDHGMGDFLDELAAMMRKTAPCSGTPEQSFAELQDLFVEMFDNDAGDGDGACGRRGGVKRDCADVGGGREEQGKPQDSFASSSSSSAFCFGYSDPTGSTRASGGSGRGRRHAERKHKVAALRRAAS